MEIIRGVAVVLSTTTTANLNKTLTDAESTTAFTWKSIFASVTPSVTADDLSNTTDIIFAL